MFRRVVILTVFLALTFPIFGRGQSPKGDPEAIARIACDGVGVVGKVFKGTKGAPMIILEENHASRAGQIQHAITLVRLYHLNGMKHIALEGYLKERPEIKTDWFINAARGDAVAKVRVAVSLLREGEISNSEFMKLVYDDIQLHPIEISSEYLVKLDDEASRAPSIYLLKIAQQSLRQEHVPTLQRLQNEMQTLTGEEQRKKGKEIFDYILSVDSWVQAKAKLMQDTEASRAKSAEEQLVLIEEIEERARLKSVALEPAEKKAMDRNLAFWRGRSAASKTMVSFTGGIADRPDVSVVPMIIGAAHTARICEMLNAVNRPYAVVSPLALKNHDERGDLDWEMFQRKYDRLSVYSEGFAQTLLKAFPSPKLKKPEPVLPEPWFQAKAEIYLFTDRITTGILGPTDPPGPPGGGKAPYGFADDAFKGKWIYIDPKKILITYDNPNNRKKKVVLFPVTLNPNDPTKRTEMWVKAGLAVGLPLVTALDRETVESMLKQALEQVQSQKEPSKKAEDKAGRVQMTINTTAIIALTQQGAAKTLLEEI